MSDTNDMALKGFRLIETEQHQKQYTKPGEKCSTCEESPALNHWVDPTTGKIVPCK